MSSRRQAIIYLLVVSLIWGIAPPVIKYALDYLPVDIFLFYRFFISLVIMIPALFIAEPDFISRLALLKIRDWGYLILGGLLGSVGQLGLLFWGLSLTTSLDGAVINATSPVLVAIAGYILLREKITPSEKLGLFIAFSGSLIVVIQPLFEGHSLFSGSLRGNILVFLGTLAWVGYVILTKIQLKEKLSPLFLTTGMFFIGFLFLLPFSIFKFLPSILNLPPSIHISVLYMALLSGTLAYWLYQKAQKIIEVSEANVILYLSPVFTFPVASLWLHEPITPVLLLGSAIIASGVIISEFSRR